MLDAQSESLSGLAGFLQRRGKPIIALLAIAMIGGLWLTLFDQVSFERNQAVAAAIVQNENRAAAFQQYTERTLDVANVAIDHVINTYGKRSGAKAGASVAAPRLISDPVLANAMFAGVYVIDEHRHVVATTLTDRGAAEAALDRVAFPQPPANNTGLSISRPIDSLPLRGAYILLARSFGTGPGSAQPRAVILIRPTEFTKLSQGADFTDTDLISLIGLDGITRSRRTGDTISWGEDLSGKLVMRRQFAHPNGHYVGPSGIDGIPRFFSHRRLARYRLFATSGLALDAAISPVAARERAYFLGGALLSVAILIAAWLLIAGITRRERQVAMLAAINRRLIEAQRVGAMSDWDFDPATEHLRWSPHLYEMYERNPRDRVSRFGDIRRYARAEDSEALRQGIQRLLGTGERQEYFLNVTLPSGVESTRHVVAVPTRDAEGRVIGIHGTDHDVTAQRKLREAEAKLAHVSRVDAMNAMASTLAHELNQPLAIATNYLAACKRVLQRASSPPEVRVMEALDTAATQVRNAGEIIRGIRAVVSGSGGARSFVSLTTICQGAVDIVRSETPRRDFDFSCAIEPDADIIWCVAVQIQQILINLIHNSLDAGAAVADRAILVRSERLSDALVAVSVSDNGPGISFVASELFSPFVTTKEAGLGLGLSICRTLVEAHGGEIELQETGPTGTTIGFTLASPTPPFELPVE